MAIGNAEEVRERCEEQGGYAAAAEEEREQLEARDEEGGRRSPSVWPTVKGWIGTIVGLVVAKIVANIISRDVHQWFGRTGDFIEVVVVVAILGWIFWMQSRNLW